MNKDKIQKLKDNSWEVGSVDDFLGVSVLSDFALCQNNQCPSSNSCLRFLGKSNDKQQVYALFQPDENGECEYFIEEIDEPNVSVWKSKPYKNNE